VNPDFSSGTEQAFQPRVEVSISPTFICEPALNIIRLRLISHTCSLAFKCTSIVLFAWSKNQLAAIALAEAEENSRSGFW